jgi:hypothetical protein
MSKLHTYHFPFLSNDLKIEFVKNIDPEIAEAISSFISVLKMDLNPQLSNTSASKLNNSSLNLPVTVSPEFLEFFETNIRYFFATRSDFNPFSKKIDKFNLDSYFAIDKEENSITKLRNFKFDSPLIKFFILRRLQGLLKVNEVFDYYFNYIDIAGSFGKVTWNAKFDLEDFNSEVSFALHNKFAYIFTPNSHKEQIEYSKFANIDKEIKPLYIILKGNNLLDLKILSLEMENFQWKHQFKAFAQENNVQIVIYTEEKEKIEI